MFNSSFRSVLCNTNIRFSMTEYQAKCDTLQGLVQHSIFFLPRCRVRLRVKWITQHRAQFSKLNSGFSVGKCKVYCRTVQGIVYHISRVSLAQCRIHFSSERCSVQLNLGLVTTQCMVQFSIVHSFIETVQGLVWPCAGLD